MIVLTEIDLPREGLLNMNEDLTQNTLRRAEEIRQIVADLLAGRYESDERKALLATFISLASSHHEAILVLLRHTRLAGSAFALFRPLVEGAYRGLFAAFQATDEQVQAIREGQEPYPRPFDHFAKSLDDLFKTFPLFSQYGGSTWKTLCGYTHGGLEQLGRRIRDDGTIQPHYELGALRELINSSTAVLVLTVIPFLQLVKKEEAAKALSDAYIARYRFPDEGEPRDSK